MAASIETCLFCGAHIENQGLGFYHHVDEHPTCGFLWHHWQERIPQDHGGA